MPTPALLRSQALHAAAQSHVHVQSPTQLLRAAAGPAGTCTPRHRAPNSSCGRRAACCVTAAAAPPDRARADATTALGDSYDQQVGCSFDLPFAQSEEYVAGLQQAQQRQHPSGGGAGFDWLAHWYPVGFTSDLDPSMPHRFVLMGIPLVIWNEGGASSSSTSSSTSSSSEGWHVFTDACPHRLVPLSEGRITPGGRLECPYHGWQFNSAGGCEVIPQEGNAHSPRACATAFPCVVRQGLLFVRPQPLPRAPVGAGGSHASLSSSSSSSSSSASSSSASSQLGHPDGILPTVAELDQEGWLTQDTWRDVPYDATSLLENVLDASHVPFTHHRSISDRRVTSNFTSMHLTQQVSAAGFSGLWPAGPRGGALGPQATSFVPPCLMQHKIVSERRGFESMVVVYAVPIGPGRCRLLNRNAFKFTGAGPSASLARLAMRLVPGWAIHIGTQVPLEDDQIFLHIGELQYVAARQQGKSAAQAYYMPSKADTYIVAFRRWISSFGGGGPFGDVARPDYLAQLAPRQGRDELLDRYSQHTANCAQCQAALRRIRGARSLLRWGASILASLALLTAAVAAVSGAGAVAAAAAGSSSGGGSSVPGWVGAVLAGALEQLGVLLAAVTGASGGLPQAAGVAAAAAADSAAAAAAVGGSSGPLARLLVWLLSAGTCWWLHGWLGRWEGLLLHGSWPPPRNLDRS